MESNTQVAEQFGQAVARGDFTTAYALLTKEAQETYSPDDLKEAVTVMTDYGEGPMPIEQVEVMSDLVLEDWPDKQDGDVAWVYVVLAGDSFNEAVFVLLTTTADGMCIRQMEWGRP